MILNFPNFKGSVDNGAKLLMAVVKGIKATCGDKKLEEIFSIALVDSQEVINTPFLTNPEYGFLIRLSQLERDSTTDPEAEIAIARATGETLFRGMIADFYELVGAEESHHLWFRNAHVTTELPYTALTYRSVIEYDSGEIEFQALKWCLQLAIVRGMLSSTITLLRERYENAVKYREENGIVSIFQNQ